MVSAVRASVSALGAASKGLAVSASNIANSHTTAPVDKVEISPAARAAANRAVRGDDEVFRPSQTVNTSVGEGGVRATVREKIPSHVEVHDPDDPNANEDGVVARPNVDLAEEFVGMIQDSAQFRASAAVIRTEDEMTGELIDSVA